MGSATRRRNRAMQPERQKQELQAGGQTDLTLARIPSVAAHECREARAEGPDAPEGAEVSDLDGGTIERRNREWARSSGFG